MEKIQIHYLKKAYPYIIIQGLKHKHKFMIDTGSPENIINTRCLYDFKHEETNYLRKIILLKREQMLQYTILNINFVNYKIDAPFLITMNKIFEGKNGFAGIIGLDFLRKMKAFLDLDLDLLVFNFNDDV